MTPTLWVSGRIIRRGRVFRFRRAVEHPNNSALSAFMRQWLSCTPDETLEITAVSVRPPRKKAK